MLNELNNGPIQSAIARLERQHEEDKQGSYLNIFFFTSTNETSSTKFS